MIKFMIIYEKLLSSLKDESWIGALIDERITLTTIK